MPHVSHRLDLCFVPQGPDSPRAVPALDALWDELVDLGWIDADGAPGAGANELVAGGFVRARVDRPGKTVLYSNHQGGFSVECPVSKRNIVADFIAASRAWREGGDRVIRCRACQQTHALEALDYRPEAAFGRGAFLLADVGSGQVTDGGLARIAHHLTPFLLVRRRVS